MNIIIICIIPYIVVLKIIFKFLSFNNYAINNFNIGNFDGHDGFENELEFEKIVNGLHGYVLWGIIFILLTIFGIIGNVLTILVLRRDPNRSPLTILLMALAFSDMLAPLPNALISFSHYHLTEQFGESLVFLRYSNILRYIIQPFSTMFTMSSSWIVTTATLFRFIAVILPFKARILITKNSAYSALFIILIFGLFSIIPIYASLKKIIKCMNELKYTVFAIQMTSEILQKIYLPGIQIVSFYLPWLICLVLWIFLLRSLKNHEKGMNFSFRKYLNSRAPDSTKNLTRKNAHGIDSMIFNYQTRLSSYNKITLMVVALCFTNLICRLFTFVFIFEVVFNQYQFKKIENNQLINQDINLGFEYAKTQFPKFLAYSLLLNNIFLCINHSCNIFIYTFTNPRFKNNLISLFKKMRFFKKKINSCHLQSLPEVLINQNNELINRNVLQISSLNTL